ncbi:MAG: type II toxin-antitoxin system HicA family toxin [Hormoscilla sp. GM7CHS1pb]|nr:type II toxin-antitoxin system HicA family toxin [Hormoscilla sp. GM7CHS1pb]
MPQFGPIKWRDLVRYLRDAGFSGPYPGSKHQYMMKEEFKLTIPNPHQGDISISLLARILRQANISKDEWAVSPACLVPRDKSTAGDTGRAMIYITLAIGYHGSIAESNCFLVPTY